MVIPVLIGTLTFTTLAYLGSQADPGVDNAGLPPVSAIRTYTDPWLEFSMAVPEHWRIIDRVQIDSVDDSLAAGYAVGFESPLSHADDVFADYVMVEFLPGDVSGAFLSDGSETRDIVVDGRTATADRIVLPGVEFDDGALDLLVLQATIRGVGYELGLYAIGELREAAVLEQAFTLLVQTFELDAEPYPAF